MQFHSPGLINPYQGAPQNSASYKHFHQELWIGHQTRMLQPEEDVGYPIFGLPDPFFPLFWCKNNKMSKLLTSCYFVNICFLRAATVPKLSTLRPKQALGINYMASRQRRKKRFVAICTGLYWCSLEMFLAADMFLDSPQAPSKPCLIPVHGRCPVREQRNLFTSWCKETLLGSHVTLIRMSSDP